MKPKPQHIQVKIDEYEINRLPGKFNRLTVDHEKHLNFAQESIELFQLVLSKEGKDSPILQYLLYKLVNLLITTSQDDCVDIKRKKTTLKLARVSCLMCSINPSLKERFRYQFHKFCPWTLPFMIDDSDYDMSNTCMTTHMMFQSRVRQFIDIFINIIICCSIFIGRKVRKY